MNEEEDKFKFKRGVIFACGCHRIFEKQNVIDGKGGRKRREGNINCFFHSFIHFHSNYFKLHKLFKYEQLNIKRIT